MKQLTLTPAPWSDEALRSLEARGFIRRFSPTPGALKAPVGETVVERVYVSEEQNGPHTLICVGVNVTDVRLGVHPDNEEILLPPHGNDVKPLYYVVCHLTEEELRARDRAGELSEADFTCLKMYPAPRGTEMFTVLKGAVHCEVSVAGDGPIGEFYVTEPRDLPITWIDLDNHVIKVAEAS